jgi:hypothetical protein
MYLDLPTLHLTFPFLATPELIMLTATATATTTHQTQKQSGKEKKSEQEGGSDPGR